MSEAETRLEARKALPVKLQMTLEKHAERAAKDAEDQGGQAPGGRDARRGGLLAVLGGDSLEVKPLIKMKGSGRSTRPSLVLKNTTVTRCSGCEELKIG